MTKEDYIRLISKRSDRYGNRLIELMDGCGCNNLQEVTLKQAKTYYERLVNSNDNK